MEEATSGTKTRRVLSQEDSGTVTGAVEVDEEAEEAEEVARDIVGR